MAEFLKDTFTDADNTALTAHVGEVGAGWTIHPSYTPNYTILNGRVYNPNAATAVYASGVPGTVEYDVEGTLFFHTTGNQFQGIVGRFSTTANTYYTVRWSTWGTTKSPIFGWELIKSVAGTQTILAQSAFTATAGATYTVRLSIRDAAKKVFIDGAEIISNTDNAITEAGRAGLRAANSTTATAGQHWNSIVGNDLAPSGPVDIVGTLGVTLAPVTTSLAGKVEVKGGIGVSLAPVTVGLGGKADVRGGLGVTLAPIQVGLSGGVAATEVAGTLAVTLPAVTAGFSGKVEVKGGVGITLAAIAVGFSGGSPVPTLDTLTDDFNDNVKGSQWGTDETQGTAPVIRESNGRTEIDVPTGVGIALVLRESAQKYSASGKASFMDFGGHNTDVGVVTLMEWGNDADRGLADLVFVQINGGTLEFYKKIFNAATSAYDITLIHTVVWSPTNHRWLRLRHNSADDTIHLDPSADGGTWGASLANTVRPSSVDVVGGIWLRIGGGCTASQAVAKTIWFDNFNVAPAVSITGTLGVTLPATTAEFSGKVEVKGGVGITLSPVGIGLSGKTDVQGVFGITLAPVTPSISGKVQTSGSFGVNLPAFTIGLGGKVDVGGGLNVILAPLNVTFQGGSPVATGGFGITLADLLVSLGGVVPVQGAMGITIASLSAAFAGVAPVSGRFGAVLQAIQIALAGIAERPSVVGNFGIILTPLRVRLHETRPQFIGIEVYTPTGWKVARLS